MFSLWAFGPFSSVFLFMCAQVISVALNKVWMAFLVFWIDTHQINVISGRTYVNYVAKCMLCKFATYFSVWQRIMWYMDCEWKCVMQQRGNVLYGFLSEAKIILGSFT